MLLSIAADHWQHPQPIAQIVSVHGTGGVLCLEPLSLEMHCSADDVCKHVKRN